MHQTTRHWLSVGATLLLLVTNGCASDESDSGHRAKNTDRDNDFEGVAVSGMPLLAAGCTLVTTGTAPVMTVTVKDGESALISLRTTDNMITVNGHVFMGTTDTNAPCDIAPTGTISVLADQSAAGHMWGRSVILDYSNGLFMLAATATLPRIKVDFTTAGDTGVLNYLKVRGSDGADQFAVGAGTGTGAAAVFAFNANAKTSATTSQAGGTGGVTVTLDAFADVTFKLTPNVMISTGAGNDRLDAAGGGAMAGVGLAFPNKAQLFGGDNDDVLAGGLGNDTLSGGLGNDTLSGCAGDDTYDMGAVTSGADIIAQACVTAPATEGNDTVDYSKRTAVVTVNLSKTLTAMNSGTDALLSGEGTAGATDGAHISDKVVTVKLGTNDDVINIPATSTVAHKVFGGAGDDTMNGGGAADVFDGEVGDDTCIGTTSTMSYGARTNPVTVTTCGGSGVTCDALNADDGDQGLTGSTHGGTGAATSTTSTVSISTLTGSGFTAASVGNAVTLSACTMTASNGTYNIVAVADDATSVILDVTAVAGFVATSCSFSEARAGTTANTGTTAPVTARLATATVTGVDHTTHALGHKITLVTPAPATASTDDGTYQIVGVTSTTVSIDKTPVAGFVGSVTGLDWTEAGNEHDNVQCASVLGGGGADMLTGDSRANQFRGGNGNDVMIGGAGGDTLIGEGGGDDLYGGDGDDTLIGGGGSSTSTGSAATLDEVDNLFGGDGNDLLEGDTGIDVFTCDGKNTPSASAVGTAPGEADIMVDFTRPSGDTGGSDCEF